MIDSKPVSTGFCLDHPMMAFQFRNVSAMLNFVSWPSSVIELGVRNGDFVQGLMLFYA